MKALRSSAAVANRAMQQTNVVSATMTLLLEMNVATICEPCWLKWTALVACPDAPLASRIKRVANGHAAAEAPPGARGVSGFLASLVLIGVGLELPLQRGYMVGSSNPTVETWTVSKRYGWIPNG